jgi:hydrogenase expression/formation protein HypC
MCLGIPGRFVEAAPSVDGLEYGIVEFAGLRRRVCIACTPEVRPGQYVIVHAGLAISILDADEADRLLEELRKMNEDEVPHEIPR